MAITFDNFTENVASGGSAGSEPFIHITGSGSDRVLILGVMIDTLADTVSAVTYGGDLLTQLYNASVSATNLYVGRLVAPQVGSFNIDIVFTGGPPTPYRAGVLTFFNVHQTTPIGGTNSQTRENNTTTPISTTVTVTGTSGMVVDAIHNTRHTGGNANAAQTEKMNNTGSWGGGTGHLGGMSYEAHTGSNITMTWENLTFESSGADQNHYVLELLSPSPSIGGILLGSD